MGDLEKKVYEGYKRTTSNSKVAKSAKSSSSKVSSTTNKKASTKKTAVRTPSIKPASKISVAKPRLAMFIDVDNVGISRENLLEILFYANGKYKIEICKLYGFSDTTLPGIRDIASEYNVVTVGKMKFKQPNTNCLDSRLLIDAYECALNNKNKIDMIFLWCYPCDLSDLFEKIIALGVNTATINNNLFDCKNKFVSQTFKLYSPYDFNVGQSMYGKVKNEATNVTPNESVENPQVNSIENSTSKETESSQPTMIDGVIPPVLPRRTIPERSNSTSLNPKPQVEPGIETEVEEETENEIDSEDTETAPKSLVEDIARKLNLQVPGDNEFSMEQNIENDENIPNPAANALMDMLLRRAGFGESTDEKKLKYEDTIGDL